MDATQDAERLALAYTPPRAEAGDDGVALRGAVGVVLAATILGPLCVEGAGFCVPWVSRPPSVRFQELMLVVQFIAALSNGFLTFGLFLVAAKAPAALLPHAPRVILPGAGAATTALQIGYVAVALATGGARPAWLGELHHAMASMVDVLLALACAHLFGRLGAARARGAGRIVAFVTVASWSESFFSVPVDESSGLAFVVAAIVVRLGTWIALCILVWRLRAALPKPLPARAPTTG